MFLANTQSLIALKQAVSVCWRLCPWAPAHVRIHPSAGLCQIPWFAGAKRTAAIRRPETSSEHLSAVLAPRAAELCGAPRFGAVGLQRSVAPGIRDLLPASAPAARREPLSVSLAACLVALQL